jgi:hypothetical protein
LTGRPAVDRDHVAADPPVGLRQRGALSGQVERVQIRLVRVHHDIHAGQLAEFAQLFGGELGVRGAAPPDHVHLAHLGRVQRLEHWLRHVSRRQRSRVPGQDPRHVHGHVADTDHRHRLGVQGECGHLDVRMPAVPVDEVGGRETARQVLAGDAEPPVAHRAGRVHHRVVRTQQVLAGHVIT